MVDKRWRQHPVEKYPSDDTYGEVGHNLAPDHVHIDTFPWPLVSPGLLDCLPRSQESKAKREAGSERRYLNVLFGCHLRRIDTSCADSTMVQ